MSRTDAFSEIINGAADIARLILSFADSLADS